MMSMTTSTRPKKHDLRHGAQCRLPCGLAGSFPRLHHPLALVGADVKAREVAALREALEF